MATESSQFVFPLQGATTLRELNTMRKEGLLTDVTIVAEDQGFECHRAVLAASCPYFKGMFSNGLRECFENAITIHGVSSKTMELVLEYAYTGMCALTRDNALQALAAADLFGLVPLRDATARFLQRCINARNCLQIRQLADIHSCSSLHEVATQFARKYFTDVIYQEEFLNLSIKTLTLYLEDDDLHVGREDLVYDAVMRWIRHDENTRKMQTEKVLELVRLPFVKPEYLKLQAKVDPLIYHNQACVKQVLEAQRHLISEECGIHSQFKQRKPRKCDSKEVMVVIGGESRAGRYQDEVHDVIYYDLLTSKWEKLTTLPDNLNIKAFSAVANGYEIYLIGGTCNNKAVSSVTVFCTYSKKWRHLPDMNKSRYHHACIAVKDTIYTLGGSDGHSCIPDVEAYNIEKETWKLVQPMIHAVKCPAAAAHDDKIYLFAGFSGAYEICKFIQTYTVDTGSWTTTLCSQIDYTCAHASVMTSHIYLLGGSSKIVKIFNPKTCLVTSKTAGMLQKRDNCAVTSIEGKLYVTGGLETSAGPSLSSAECFCPLKNTWKRITELPLGRHRHSTVTARVPVYQGGYIPSPGREEDDLQ